MKFTDLPSEAYPLTIEYLRGDTQEVVWRTHIDGPSVVSVPSLAKHLRVPVGVRVTYANGKRVEAWP